MRAGNRKRIRSITAETARRPVFRQPGIFPLSEPRPRLPAAGRQGKPRLLCPGESRIPASFPAGSLPRLPRPAPAPCLPCTSRCGPSRTGRPGWNRRRTGAESSAGAPAPSKPFQNKGQKYIDIPLPECYNPITWKSCVATSFFIMMHGWHPDSSLRRDFSFFFRKNGSTR